jgi:hypothetical protein
MGGVWRYDRIPVDIESLTVQTDRFNHRDVKPHFINPCCFGEDFAAWLREETRDLAAEGYETSEPIQEDYGWGFWMTRGRDHFWISVSFCGEGPTEGPAEWVVSVAPDAGLNPLRRLFHKPDAAALARLRTRVWQALRSESHIREIAHEG